MAGNITVSCLDCEYESPYSPRSVNCPRCGSLWREAIYDLASLAKTFQSQLRNREFDLWRYREILPVRRPNPELTLGEGGTPLIRAVNLGMMLGCPNIFIKDERQGPTASFKDRQAAVTMAALKEAGITEAVIASTGNVAISYSAYAARAGIKLWAFLTSLVPAEKMREVAIYGTQVVKVTASYDQAKQVAAEFARQRGLYLERGAMSIPSVESMKTIAYEISEQLTTIHRHRTKSYTGELPTTPWRSPDWYIQSVSGGLGPLGVLKGFDEMRLMGLIDQIPAIAMIQVDGCAPMASAWQDGQEIAQPIRSPRTHIATLATGDPGRTYTLLHNRVQKGTVESVTDEEAFRALHILAKMEGLSVEPAAAVAFAGLIKLVRAGRILPTDVIIINCTGHTMPIEPVVLGKGWARNVILPSQMMREIPEEGLLSALNRVAEDRFPRIVIADDHADARRLIRRVLQSQGNYTLYEAKDGKEAIQIAQLEHPDLIILDLMMPEMDGFDVLDALKTNPHTANIPVIVVTAKVLTQHEKRLLSGQIKSLMQKGDFLNDELLEEIETLVK